MEKQLKSNFMKQYQRPNTSQPLSNVNTNFNYTSIAPQANYQASNNLQKNIYSSNSFRPNNETLSEKENPEDILANRLKAVQNNLPGTAAEEIVFDGKSLRKSVQRRTIDYAADQIAFYEALPWYRDRREFGVLQVDPLFNIKMLPPIVQLSHPSNAITTKFISNASNKVRCPTNVVRWTPEGRRLITGCSTGEFTLWNGLTFNFETILQAHECAVRAMEWSHNDNWMVTADQSGVIKYWQSNMNNLKEFQGHDAAIRGLSFSPTDAKFVTCSDDSTLKIWNFNEGLEEKSLLGHAADVKTVDWHPYKALIASGSKDNMLKLWDPKIGKCLTTLHTHKSNIHSLQWNQNGNWLVSTARDHLIKVYDIRMMKEFLSLRGHRKEVSTVAWHPHYERVFATGGSDGSIMFWDLSSSSPTAQIKTAHDNYIWSLSWHPIGHILVSGSNDHSARFWTRPRPGELFKSTEARYHGGTLPADPTKASEEEEDEAMKIGLGEGILLPGFGRAVTPPPYTDSNQYGNGGINMTSFEPAPTFLPGLGGENNQEFSLPGLGRF